MNVEVLLDCGEFLNMFALPVAVLSLNLCDSLPSSSSVSKDCPNQISRKSTYSDSQ